MREEENLPARLAIISGAGLMGLMIGSLRGRFLKKILYTGIGAGAGAGICYPDEAREIAEIGVEEGKRNVMIAYNFVTGGKPDI